jgi:hypothetical protein
LTALLQLAPEQSLPLVNEFLHAESGSEEDVGKAEAAALALSDARLPEAFLTLKEWWPGTRDPELRKTGLLAIATLRQPEALEFLLSIIAEGKPQDAKDAVRAMGVYARDIQVWQRVRQTVENREDVSLLPTLEKVSATLLA